MVTDFVGGQAAGGSNVQDLTISGDVLTGGQASVSIFDGSTFIESTDNVLSRHARYGVNIKAWASWRLYEKQWLKLKRRFSHADREGKQGASKVPPQPMADS